MVRAYNIVASSCESQLKYQSNYNPFLDSWKSIYTRAHFTALILGSYLNAITLYGVVVNQGYSILDSRVSNHLIQQYSSLHPSWRSTWILVKSSNTKYACIMIPGIHQHKIDDTISPKYLNTPLYVWFVVNYSVNHTCDTSLTWYINVHQ